MGVKKKGEGKRGVLLTVGFLRLTLQALALVIVEEQGPGLKTQLFCTVWKFYIFIVFLQKLQFHLGKKGGKKKEGYYVAGQTRKQALFLSIGTTS